MSWGLRVFVFSYPRIFVSSCLRIFASSSLLVFVSSYLRVFVSSYLRVFMSLGLRVFESSCLLVFVSLGLRVFACLRVSLGQSHNPLLPTQCHFGLLFTLAPSQYVSCFCDLLRGEVLCKMRRYLFHGMVHSVNKLVRVIPTNDTCSMINSFMQPNHFR